jgi:hypothetical protein
LCKRAVEPNGSIVLKRHIFFLAGFDPFDVAAQYRRFRREAGTFQKTWNVSATVSELPVGGADPEHWTVSARGPNWATHVTFEPLAWHDIVRADVAGAMLPRLRAGLETFWDLIVSGTAARYFAANYRYGLFFLVPFLYLLLFAAVAVAVAWLIASELSLALPLAILAAIVIVPAVFALLLRWPGRRWRVAQGLADWITPRDYMYGRRADLEARVNAFAQRILECARRADVDEILVVGHSLGATIALDVLAQALSADPQLGQRGPRLCLLTIGATVPKLALHPAATRLRACAEKVAAADAIAWGEFQSRQDPISFYRLDPVTLRPFEDNSGGKPHIRVINFYDLLEHAKMERIKWRFMRVHYQFVMAAEKRGTYDYFMLICGPAPFARAIWAPGGVSDLIGADGSYQNEPAAARRIATDAS